MTLELQRQDTSMSEKKDIFFMIWMYTTFEEPQTWSTPSY